MTAEPRRRCTLLRPVGLLLVAAALMLTAYNIWDNGRAAASVQQVLAELNSAVPARQQPTSGAPSPQEEPEQERQMPTALVDGNEYIGTLYFPTLELTLPVMSGWDEGKLKISPCRYLGTVWDHLVIAGHNYRSHFGPIRDLESGDPVTFTDVEGTVYAYTVAETEVLQPTAIGEMVEAGWDLTLFTCTTGGQARFAVRCTAGQ